MLTCIESVELREESEKGDLEEKKNLGVPSVAVQPACQVPCFVLCFFSFGKFSCRVCLVDG
jgi:hypothetical protein